MSDNYLRFEEYLDGYVVTGFTGDATVTNVEIPATHSDKTVYGVRGSSASEGEYISIFGPTYDGNIQSVTIADGITFVGVGAFANCDNLSSLVLPNTLQFIDEAAFYNCVSLPSIIIPNSVTTIGDFAFTNCKGLVSVTLPTNPITISNYAFTGCSGLSNYSALALSRYGISPYVDVNPPKLISTDGLAVFLSKLHEVFLLEKGNEYNMSLPDSVTYDQNGGITFNGMKLRDVNDLTKVGNVNLGLPITAGSNISLTASNGKLVVSSSAGQITVDDTLSTTSENAVQNKVVTAAIDSKADLTNSSQVVTLGGLKDGNNANYKLRLPDTTSWTSDKTIATTDQISGGGGSGVGTGTVIYNEAVTEISSWSPGLREINVDGNLSYGITITLPSILTLTPGKFYSITLSTYFSDSLLEDNAFFSGVFSEMYPILGMVHTFKVGTGEVNNNISSAAFSVNSSTTCYIASHMDDLRGLSSLVGGSYSDVKLKVVEY